MRAVRRGLRAWALALGFTLAAALPAGADFEAGQRAWDAGRAGDAVAAWQSAAETGDSRSMLALGHAYARGVGTLQDLVEAHKWLNLAASFGSAEAAAARDALAREMTVEERAEARKLARAWRAARKVAEELRRTPGKTFRDCEACPEMVVVPAGSFTMGSPASEEGRYDDEGPQHRVTISQPFAVGRYEVTFSEWDACVSAGGCNRHRPDDEGWGRGRRPVMNVSWDDAKSYVSWLSRKTGKRYRLLTEAEWEYAARAGTTGPFHFGNTISTDRANYNGNYTYGSGSKGVSRRKTVPVGSFPANRFGLHDVHGNVWEWVEDCWHGHDSYAGAPSDGSAWTTGGECGRHVLRGGSWDYRPRGLRSAYRYWLATGNRDDNDGFRVARTLTP